MSALHRRLPELTSLALVVVPIVVGVLVAPALPERMIVGWHMGLDGEVTLRHAPRLLGLIAIPAATALLYITLCITRLVVDTGNRLNTYLFEVLAHLLLAAMAFGQGWLLAVNL